MRTTRNLFGLFLALLTVFAIGMPQAFGQAVSGDLVGTVLDATGAAVPNASVTAINKATAITSSASTSAKGEYRFGNLPIGTYSLRATAPGFGTASLENVSVELNKIATANLTMQVGAVTTTVEVTESAQTIDTTTAQIQTTFDSKMAQDLPSASAGAGVLNLSLLSSGVASSGGVGSGSGPSVGGQRPRNNNFTIEGVDNNSKSVTGPLVFVPNDAVAEFTLLQNQFSPEFGHSSGGQFNTIVKSGTNSFHGSIYEYLQNRNLDALDQAFANQGILSNPRYDQSRLGATFGGPIKRNKLFFFTNFEYEPQGQASTPGGAVYTPTAAGYATLGAIPGISKTNLGILQQYGTAAAVGTKTVTVGGKSIPIGILPIAAPNFQNSYYGVSSVDYTISDRDQLRGRFIYNSNDAIDNTPTLPAFFLLNPTRYYLATLSEFHNFSANVNNEFRVGYNRYNNSTATGNFKFPGLDSFPNLNFDDLSLQIGPDPNGPQFTIQNTYQVTDNLTWTAGNHTVKAGFEFRKYISPQSFTQRSRGDYEYSNLDLFLTDHTPDVLAERSLGNVIYYGDQIAAYPYLNDSWRIRPNFTINLGFRFEYTTVPFGQRSQSLNALASVPGVLTFGQPKEQGSNFAPRVGIAYSPGTSGKTSIRAGFGMAYDVLYDNIGILSLPPQLSTTVDSVGDVAGYLANGGIRPNASGGGPLNAADARANTANYIGNQKVPYSIQWNAGVQHVFATNYTIEARYLGTRGVDLNVQQRINVQDVVDGNNFIPTLLSQPSPAQIAGFNTTLGSLNKRLASGGNIVPAFANAGFTNPIVQFSPIGNSTYHGLAVQLDRRFASGLTFKGAYTWSHLIDDSTADFFTTVLTPRRAQDFQNLRADKSASALDHRQRFTLALVYDVPFFKTGNWLMRNIVGNWELAPIYTYQSPEYATPQSAVDSNLNGDSAGDRTILNASGTPGTSSGVTGYDKSGNKVAANSSSANPIVYYVANNPNAQYIQAQRGTLANTGRNILAGRPIDDVDVTALKRFSFGERLKFELQGQLYNALNHPQYLPGYLNDVRSISYTNAGTKAYLTPGNSAFNRPDLTFGSNPRVIQVVAKFIF